MKKKDDYSVERVRIEILLYVHLLMESFSDDDKEWNKSVFAECHSIRWAVTLGIPIEKIVNMIERTQTQDL